MDFKNMCHDVEPYVVEMRRWFHAHPELSLYEVKTTDRIVQELEAMDIPYVRMPSEVGVLATINGGKPGPRLGIRADIDALPITEQTGLPYASQNPGVMHACGHDAHTAMLLGAAKVLRQAQSELPGTVKLIFQPAEEVGKGTEELMKALEKDGGLDGVFGLHVMDHISCGELQLKYGSTASGVIGFHVDVVGKGGHGSRPCETCDPIRAMCDLIVQLESIPSNYYTPTDFCTLTVGKLQAGTSRNIIPEQASFDGTIRRYDPAGGDRLREIFRRICTGVGQIHGVDVRVNLEAGLPPVANDDRLIDIARSVVADMPNLAVSEVKDGMSGSDNVGLFTERWPGFYGFLGVRNPGGEVLPLHNSCFNLDENALGLGCAFMCQFVWAFLNQ